MTVGGCEYKYDGFLLHSLGFVDLQFRFCLLFGLCTFLGLEYFHSVLIFEACDPSAIPSTPHHEGL